jgi:hypothetical protein
MRTVTERGVSMCRVAVEAFTYGSRVRFQRCRLPGLGSGQNVGILVSMMS